MFRRWGYEKNNMTAHDYHLLYELPDYSFQDKMTEDELKREVEATIEYLYEIAYTCNSLKEYILIVERTETYNISALKLLRMWADAQNEREEDERKFMTEHQGDNMEI